MSVYRTICEGVRQALEDVIAEIERERQGADLPLPEALGAELATERCSRNPTADAVRWFNAHGALVLDHGTRVIIERSPVAPVLQVGVFWDPPDSARLLGAPTVGVKGEIGEMALAVGDPELPLLNLVRRLDSDLAIRLSVEGWSGD